MGHHEKNHFKNLVLVKFINSFSNQFIFFNFNVLRLRQILTEGNLFFYVETILKYEYLCERMSIKFVKCSKVDICTNIKILRLSSISKILIFCYSLLSIDLSKNLVVHYKCVDP